jgi:Spy/CpxP family protein refolding chaperone
MKWTGLVAAAFLAACGADNAKKDDLTILEGRMRSKALEETNALRQEIAKIREEQKIFEATNKKVELHVQEAERIMKEAVAATAKIDVANTNVVKSLEIQEQYLKQLLESIRSLIDELKKK